MPILITLTKIWRAPDKQISISGCTQEGSLPFPLTASFSVLETIPRLSRPFRNGSWAACGSHKSMVQAITRKTCSFCQWYIMAQWFISWQDSTEFGKSLFRGRMAKAPTTLEQQEELYPAYGLPGRFGKPEQNALVRSAGNIFYRPSSTQAAALTWVLPQQWWLETYYRTLCSSCQVSAASREAGTS